MGSLREAEKFSFGMVGMLLDVIGKGLSSPIAIAKALTETFDETISVSEIRRKLGYAHRRGYLQRFGQNGAYNYQLSKSGEQRLAQLSFQLVRFNAEKWDGLWRILIFDIPETHRPQRDMIRHLIQQLGMRQLQKSVWLTPADCKAEFDQLRLAYGMEQSHLLLLEVKNAPSLESYRKYWW